MKIVAVTSCPVGIAHTYMAAANLKKAAESKGITIKIETQGAQGPENVITDADIAQADAAIIASDVSIRDSDRFDSLPTLECGVQEAVKDANGIIEEVMEAIS
ncbi:PTS fructose transporter subunit IIB [Vagococcus xieshaowenii]|uniref:PTS sugar transporter subunit IIC n=1 Tax=Vagococcus xieshaowenii TaxID=2562451 RepID=A0AAJ5JMV1_9ENTE|nr:fructose PTS transporter subunit IIB [Vagococcus xieshaowenii]QCA28859.1 PTS sugar transporter subunit IIC [Vagococcus xieshaowenii]TFZ43434.1 PTS sugar transporter subunit IIC [Vagococcus xieshaowenii]